MPDLRVVHSRDIRPANTARRPCDHGVGCALAPGPASHHPEGTTHGH